MSSTRLLVLGMIRMSGQAHGYQVRRELLSWRADAWGNVKPGSIYHALRKLTGDGRLEAVNTEEGDGGPERTIYRLTEDGETEFFELLRRRLADPGPGLDAAIPFFPMLGRQELISLLRTRLVALRGIGETTNHLHEAIPEMHKPHQVAELYRWWQVQTEASQRWAQELIDRLTAGEYQLADDPQ